MGNARAFQSSFVAMPFRPLPFLLLPCLISLPVLAVESTPPIEVPASNAPVPLPDVAPPTEAELYGTPPIVTPTPAVAPTPVAVPNPVINAAPVEMQRPPDTFGQTPEQLYPWLENVAMAYPKQAKLRIIGDTSSGASMVAMEITPPNVSPWKLKRLVVICRQHGNEPEATGSGARFIYHWLKPRNQREKNLAAKTALLIVPIANPDGAARYERRTARGIDMNRDWGKNKSVEVGVLTKWIRGWKPHLVIDNHQWLPADHMPVPMAEASGGARARMAARTMSARSAQRGFALSARSRVGLDTLCHRFWGQRFGTPAVLLETRHQPSKAGARDKALVQAEAALWGAAESAGK